MCLIKFYETLNRNEELRRIWIRSVTNFSALFVSHRQQSVAVIILAQDWIESHMDLTFKTVGNEIMNDFSIFINTTPLLNRAYSLEILYFAISYA